MACVAEHELNRRLAPPTYLDVVPLRLTASGLSIGGIGTVVDWLVVMRRLDDTGLLDRAITAGRVERVHAWLAAGDIAPRSQPPCADISVLLATMKP
jgi:aminoglycoside phosphotransferase family enzyme